MAQTCRFCKSNKLELVFEENRLPNDKQGDALFACTNSGFGRHGPIVCCRQCGIYYVDEKVSQRQISTYYEVAKDLLYFKEQPARGKTFARYLQRLDQTYPKKGRLLDVGTNTGLFVKLARQDSWDAFGLEPNRWAVKYARENYGVKLIASPFAANIFPPESFDAITMWDVIEHFTDPVSEMKKVFCYLRKGGVFAFTTIDPESPLAKVLGTNWPWYMTMHKVFFSPRTMETYLQSTGFQKIRFSPHIRYLSAGYLASRMSAINVTMAKGVQEVVARTGLSKKIVPYYANDLYDCYAFK